MEAGRRSYFKMKPLPALRFYELFFRKRTQEGEELYLLRYSPNRTAEEQTRRVIQRWAEDPNINLTRLDAIHICRQMVSIKRKGPRELVKILH